MPLLQHQDRSVFFIHIPKTGGSSLYEANLRRQDVTIEVWDRQGTPCTPQHYEIKLLEERWPAYREHSPFTIVRDPWSRTCSEFQWANRNPQWAAMDEWLDAKLRAYLKGSDQYILDNHLRPQREFVGDHVQIFAFDHYARAQHYVEQKLGRSFDWSLREKIGRYQAPDITLLSDRVRQMWTDLYQQDVELYRSLEKNG